jgi:hypothetical protein
MGSSRAFLAIPKASAWWRLTMRRPLSVDCEAAGGSLVATRARSSPHMEKEPVAVTENASKNQIRLACLAGSLVVALIIVGAVWHGVSPAVFRRLWQNILDRPGAPMTFRFILQPSMATIAALRDGVNDARVGRSPSCGRCSPIALRGVAACARY